MSLAVPPGLITYLSRYFHANSHSNAWLSGMVMTVTIVQIPQRFMIVDRLSPIDSGVRLLPFAAVMVSTSVLVTVAIAKFKVFAVTSLILGALLEIAVVAGFSRASTHVGIEPSQYVFQILAGVCVGICNIILLLLTPHLVEKEDLGKSSRHRRYGFSRLS